MPVGSDVAAVNCTLPPATALLPAIVSLASTSAIAGVVALAATTPAGASSVATIFDAVAGADALGTNATAAGDTRPRIESCDSRPVVASMTATPPMFGTATRTELRSGDTLRPAGV